MSTALAEIPAPAPMSITDILGNLTIKQKSFADLWIEHRNGRLAAELAGYSGDEASLSQMAYENLRKPEVAAYIQQKLQERQLSPDRVLAELGDIAAYSLDSIAVEGSPVKTQDKIRALELVGKFHKLFVDRVETETADPDRIGNAVVQFLREAVEKHRAALATESSQQADGPTGPAVALLNPPNSE